MSKVEIFGFGGSTCVRTALMVCEEKGVEHAVVPLDFGAASHRTLHPFLKIPAMRHGKVSPFETAAIATYVDAIGPGPALQPDRAEDRALMWQWVSSSIDHLYDPFVRSALSDGGDSAAAQESRQNAFEAIEGALAGHRFFAGEALSLADLFIAPMIAFDLGRRRREGVDAAFDRQPGLAAWYDRVAARDSFKRTVG